MFSLLQKRKRLVLPVTLVGEMFFVFLLNQRKGVVRFFLLPFLKGVTTMILIISSKISGIDYAITILGENLKRLGLKYFLLNPHNLISGQYSLIQKDDTIRLSFSEDVFISPEIVYMATNWRCDCIVRYPESIDYPGIYRSRVHQFMQDIRFSLENTIWIPGSYECIERADSKTTLLREAFLSGLSVPSFTMNSFSKSVCNLDEELFRKSLGFPFIVSLNNKKGIEVGVTTTNTFHNPNKDKNDDQLWQWQSAIKTIGQLRMYVVGSKIWSVCWKKEYDQSDIQDYRQANQIEKREILWEPHIVPEVLADGILKLMKRLKIIVAAPEFLITEEGNYIFIDLNPCGDWLGFFSESVNKDIICSLTKLFTQYL